MAIYRILSILFLPLIAIYIFWRAFLGKENLSRIEERFGFSSKKFEEKNKVAWIHAVSVGEANSAFDLAQELIKKDDNIRILFTTTTLTAASIISSKTLNCEDKIIHQFLPIDSYFIVRKFLKSWNIKIAIFIESEIWPNFIIEAFKLGIATHLINARISAKSFERWKFAKKFSINIFDYFSLIFAQSLEDKARIEKLTNKSVYYFGNLKSQATPLQYDESSLKALANQINNRKFWLCSSTHSGEEEIIFNIHKKLKKKFSDILTIIVPRHPNRAMQIKALEPNLKFSQRSLNEKINSETEIYLADTMGELGLFYALSDFTFLGGSMVSVGGHNPFEAAQLNCTIISGDQVENNKTAFQELAFSNACILAKNENEIFYYVEKFLEDKNLAQSYANKAFAIVSQNQNIVKNVVERLV